MQPDPELEPLGFSGRGGREAWRRTWCLWLRIGSEQGMQKARGGIRDGGRFKVSMPNCCLDVPAISTLLSYTSVLHAP